MKRLLAIFLALAALSCQAASFPTGWKFSCPITLAQAWGDVSNLPVTITQASSQLPSNFWANVKNGGADVRFSSDSAGSSPLHRDNNAANGNNLIISSLLSPEINRIITKPTYGVKINKDTNDLVACNKPTFAPYREIEQR